MTPRVATVYLPLADPSSSPTWACGELVGSCQQVSRYAIVWRAAQPHPGTPEHIVPAEAPVHQRPRCTDLQAVHLAALRGRPRQRRVTVRLAAPRSIRTDRHPATTIHSYG